ncbi:PilN domain-containing protein [Sodalinema gerasimenkoae]|uniref:PilN domain-containing protein n=1 Tax=Sodalinema gerasimenkoae TaxID=2862348 RepID=UPI00135CC67D|nr:PilN domain-containing protein [Sodalinema gerasimenkoae]
MYNIEINFLNDRPEYRPESVKAKPSRQRRDSSGNMPIIAGGGVALAFLALVVGGWAYLSQVEIPRLQAERDELDQELGNYQRQEDRLRLIQEEVQQIRTQTDALAGVFNYISPWSALLQDLRDRTPLGVRIQNVQQTNEPPRDGPPPQRTESGRPPSVVTIEGIAQSFNDVNDFVLLLKESNLYMSSGTHLVEAELEDYRAQSITFSESRSRLALAPVVAFTIQTQVREVPATDILQELQRKGALGLVNRIQELQRRGVI